MCRNVPLERRVKIAGVMDMILSTISIITAAVDINELLSKEDHKDAVERYRTFILICITIAISGIKFIMGIVLWNGANWRNAVVCLRWLYVSGTLWFIHIIIFNINLTMGPLVLFTSISSALAILIRILVMYIVYRFIKEICYGRPPEPINTPCSV